MYLVFSLCLFNILFILNSQIRTMTGLLLGLGMWVKINSAGGVVYGIWLCPGMRLWGAGLVFGILSFLFPYVCTWKSF